MARKDLISELIDGYFWASDFRNWNSFDVVVGKLSYDVIVDDDGMVVEMKTPGVKKKEYLITIDGRFLQIAIRDKGDVSVEIPEKYNLKSVSAKYEDGVMKVSFKKNEENIVNVKID